MTRVSVHAYPPLVKGYLIKRYKRFFAAIELEDGTSVTAHCANTGPMTGLVETGSPVYLSRDENPQRKLAFTWEMVRVGETWVGVNTNLPNRVVKKALAGGLFPGWADGRTTIRAEVPYGQKNDSRIDFLLTRPDGPPTYIEVKNTTWARGELALFPDTVTTRGQKHLIELLHLRPDAGAVMLYFINRGDCTAFAPGDSKDSRYGQLFRQALAGGVEMFAGRFEVTPSGIYYLGAAGLRASERDL